MSSLDLPILREDRLSLDWRDAQYTASIHGSRTFATVRHELSGAQALEDAIESGDCAWIVDVRCPRTLYSEVFRIPRQGRIEWPEHAVLGEIYLTPGILAEREFRLETAGLIDLWGNQPIPIPRGSWLARGMVYPIDSLTSSILRFHRREDYEEGEMRVEPDNTDGDIRFNVWVAPLSFERCSESLELQLTALTAALGRIGLLYPPSDGAVSIDDDGESVESPRLARLRQLLENKGVPTWHEPENFDPAWAATTLWPFEFRTTAQPDSEDEE